MRQLQSADKDGLAYGALVNQTTGRRRKKKGFYPANHLVKVTNEDLEKVFSNATEVTEGPSRDSVATTCCQNITKKCKKKQSKPDGKDVNSNPPMVICNMQTVLL